MGQITRDGIPQFYASFRDANPASAFLDVAEAFVLKLLDERDFTGCTFFTSMMWFSISRHAQYPEWSDHPRLAISAQPTGELIIELAQPDDLERVTCAPDDGLAVFDQLFAKWVSLT